MSGATVSSPDPWPAGASTTLPRPQQPKSLAVPADDGLRLHDDEGRSPAAPDTAMVEAAFVARRRYAQNRFANVSASH